MSEIQSTNTRAVVALFVLAATECATGAYRPTPQPLAGSSDADPWNLTVRDAALWFLRTHAAIERVDCSGLVTAILARAGTRVAGSSETFWLDAQREGRVVDQPTPGNLAFFDYTYDANSNGKVDDELTHVAVVISVEDNGTVVMVHRGSNEIKGLRMNGCDRNPRMGHQVKQVA